MNDLTVCYITSRRQPRIEWFFESLETQAGDSITAACDIFDGKVVARPTDPDWSEVEKELQILPKARRLCPQKGGDTPSTNTTKSTATVNCAAESEYPSRSSAAPKSNPEGAAKLEPLSVAAIDNIPIIVVDRFTRDEVGCDRISFDSMMGAGGIHVSPKPNVWSGPHRLTKEDYFSAANARNTAAALCETDWIAYVDDLSVLGPHWLQSVREAMAGNYIALGAYQKVRKLIVENGVPVSYEEYDGGKDTRWGSGADDHAVPCAGTWMFGCSVAMPIEALLKINGWPEALCDGMGFEDCCTGAALQKAGYVFKYDRRMLTLESEEDHHVEPAMKRSDFGVSPRDKSHKALEIALSSYRFDNDFNLRELRERTLAGEPFPVRLNPQHEWFSGTPLKDL